MSRGHAALSAETDTTVGTLEHASSSDFDAVYLDSQVKTQQEVLTLLNTKLLEQAKNRDLVNLLSSMRDTVEEHLSGSCGGCA